MQDRFRPSVAGVRQLKGNARRRKSLSSKGCAIKISIFVHHQATVGRAAHSSAGKIEQRFFGLPKQVPTTPHEQPKKDVSNCAFREHCHFSSGTWFILSFGTPMIVHSTE